LNGKWNLCYDMTLVSKLCSGLKLAEILINQNQNDELVALLSPLPEAMVSLAARIWDERMECITTERRAVHMSKARVFEDIQGSRRGNGRGRGWSSQVARLQGERRSSKYSPTALPKRESRFVTMGTQTTCWIMTNANK
jgi:hypothetical protein